MSNYGIMSKNHELVKNLLSNGKSAGLIAKHLGCAKCSVLRYIRDNNLYNKNISKRNNNNLLKDKKDLVLQLFNGGLSCNKIGKQLGHSPSQIWKLIHKEGLFTTQCIYSIDETYFDNIDTQNKAYYLGWMFSDGCVNDKGKFRIQIQKEDESILQQLKEDIKYTGPLYYLDPPKRFPHRKSQVCLCINRKIMADKLINLGCVPNKSLVLDFPDNIKPELLRHFIRGYFDGDGGIHKTKCVVGITSTDIFNKKLKEILKELIGLKGGKLYYRYKHTNTCQMVYNKVDSLVFLNWIYRDCALKLERKYNRYLQLMEQNAHGKS